VRKLLSTLCLVALSLSAPGLVGCGVARADQCPGGIAPGSQGSLRFTIQEHYSELPRQDEILKGRSVELPCVAIGDEAVHGSDPRQPGEQLVEFYNLPNAPGESAPTTRVTIRYPGRGQSATLPLDRDAATHAYVSYDYFEDADHQNDLSSFYGNACVYTANSSATLRLDLSKGGLEFSRFELCGNGKAVSGQPDTGRSEHMILQNAVGLVQGGLQTSL